MKREHAIMHILRICDVYKHMVHWQIAARISLASLYADARVKKVDRDFISGLISNGKLMDYQHLIR
jgi:hypothetical protein